MAAESPPRPPPLRGGGDEEAGGFVSLGRGPAREKKKPAWARDLARSITTVDELAKVIRLTPEELEGARRAEKEGLSLRITPHYLSLVDREDPRCPIRKQVVPQAAEKVTSPGDLVDPLGEEAHTVAPHLVRRYPDRALLLATDRCAVYCRFCTRSRLVGDGGGAVPMTDLEPAMAWLEANPAVRDVILSGGDPLAMATPRIVRILERLRRIESVETIRLATRVPVALPSRITSELLAALKPLHPLWVMTHFNHPKELAPAALKGLERLADAGFPVMNQTVLLRGINDDPEVLTALFRGLVRARARPYYLLQMDPVRGTGHLRTPVSRGVEILEALQGKLSGIAIPKLVVDTPGGMGKVPLAPDYVVSRAPGRTLFRTPRGVEVEYVDP
ncbi:MAG: KamA family radical SAM protein [Myxococcales bacterium]|nr:KamA family radical SAM protein [Myxococcales bacterium]